ncbi:MAG: TatD family hydrolase [Lachnospiraceae bacterium]|nr:TatD family hydrolase [Lachnospiraceae bacterium]
MQYITDTHAHYDDHAFDEDRDSLLASLKDGGIGWVINVGASLRGCRESLALANQYPFIYAALGVHPSETAELTEEDMQHILQDSKDPKVVAIGEIGLDYHYPDDPSPEHQKKWFKRQMALAGEAGLPVVIHSREAAKDTLDILTEYKNESCGGVIHCYSYSKESAREFLELGYHIGIGGVLTFKNGKKLKEAAAYIPMDRILLETDCPYLAPSPYRGERNCSLYIPHVVQVLVQIKGITEEEVIRITSENAAALFGLPPYEG